jgi:hypothetical protein
LGAKKEEALLGPNALNARLGMGRGYLNMRFGLVRMFTKGMGKGDTVSSAGLVLGFAGKRVLLFCLVGAVIMLMSML